MNGTVNVHRYVFESLMRDLVGHRRRPSLFVVYLFLWYRTGAQGKESVPLSLRTIAHGCGLSKSSVQTAIKELVGRRLLSVHRERPTQIPKYSIHEPWRKRATLARGRVPESALSRR